MINSRTVRRDHEDYVYGKSTKTERITCEACPSVLNYTNWYDGHICQNCAQETGYFNYPEEGDFGSLAYVQAPAPIAPTSNSIALAFAEAKALQL